MGKIKFFKCLAIAAIIAIYASSCSGGDSSRKFSEAELSKWNTETKKATPIEFAVNKDFNGRVIFLEEKISEDKYNMGIVADGKLVVDPDTRNYTSIIYIRDLNVPDIGYYKSWVNTKKLDGALNIISGKEILPPAFSNVHYYEDDQVFWTTTPNHYQIEFNKDGKATGNVRNSQGEAVSHSEFEPFLKANPVKNNFICVIPVPGAEGEKSVCASFVSNGMTKEVKWGLYSYKGKGSIEEEMKNNDFRFDYNGGVVFCDLIEEDVFYKNVKVPTSPEDILQQANEKRKKGDSFIKLEPVPGKPYHFVCTSIIDGKKKCGIYHYPANSVTVPRVYDEYEFLGNNGSYAANAVRFYDARHTTTSAPLVLNCNGEEAGTRVGDKFYEDLVKDWKRKHYGEKWVD